MKFRFIKGYNKSAITYLPKEVFDQKYNIVVKEILTDLGGVEEGKAFLHEWKYRNKFDELFLKNLIVYDYDKLSDEVKEWLACGIRPEHINLALIIYFNTYIDEFNLHKYYSEEELIDLVSNINNCVSHFNQASAKLYECKYNDYSYITEQYDKYNPSGLGFGLITTSASKALLFQALNASTVDKQIGQNARAKRYAVSQYADSKANQRTIHLSSLYNNFREDLLKEIDNSLKLFEKMKKKCSKKDLESEEIKKRTRLEENFKKETLLLDELNTSDKIFRNEIMGNFSKKFISQTNAGPIIFFSIVIIIAFVISFISVFNIRKNAVSNISKDNINEVQVVSYPKIYLNSLDNDIDIIKKDKNAKKVASDLINSYNTSTFKNILDNEKNLDNYLYIGFISYLTNFVESTALNNGSKEKLNYENSPVTDYNVSKIYVNGFVDNKINSKNNISSILYQLSNGLFLRCDFVRLNNVTTTIDEVTYEDYDVWYSYDVYNNYEEFVDAIKPTNYKLSGYHEMAIDDFNKTINDNKEFIDDYIDYKLNYYYPNIK